MDDFETILTRSIYRFWAEYADVICHSRVVNSLRRTFRNASIHTFEDLCNRTESEIQNLRNFGPEAMKLMHLYMVHTYLKFRIE